LACETIPSFAEAEVLRELLGRSQRGAWVSFCCRNADEISDGTPIERCASLFEGCDGLLALGVNCTAPQHVAGLVAKIRRTLSEVPIVAYANSGESFDATDKSWSGASDADAFAAHAQGWIEQGATLIGGCCRTGPQHIRAIRRTASK
jgi:homocysteine S-methyltransferase